jgi:hypothetical protein
VNLRNKKILKKGLVAHGNGSSISNTDSLHFSNVPNSMVHQLENTALEIPIMVNLGKATNYLGWIRRTIKLLKEILFYIAIKMFRSKKWMEKYVIAKDVQWFHLVSLKK